MIPAADMTRRYVLLTDDRFNTDYDMERKRLREVGAELIRLDRHPPEERSRLLRRADALLVNHFSVDAAVIEQLERARIIARYGVGYDNVDVPAATRRGIWVSNVPDYATEEVAEHTIALLLACVRGIAFRDRRIRRGEWNITGVQRSFRMSGAVLGIVGYGRIGSAVAHKLSSFGLSEILVYDPYVDQSRIRAAGCLPCDLEELLRRSDYLSLHTPLTPETQGMISAERIALMKPEAVIVNTARGPVLDEEAAIRALREGRIGYCGLDVFASEPLDPASPFRELENVILTDHMAWYSEQSRVELRTKGVENVIAVLAGKPPRYPVNEPAGKEKSDAPASP